MKTATRGLRLDNRLSICDNDLATPYVAERQLRANGNPSRVPVDYIPLCYFTRACSDVFGLADQRPGLERDNREQHHPRLYVSVR